MVELCMTQVCDKQLDTEMSRQLNTMLIISHKHQISTKSRDINVYFMTSEKHFRGSVGCDAQIKICRNPAFGRV